MGNLPGRRCVRAQGDQGLGEGWKRRSRSQWRWEAGVTETLSAGETWASSQEHRRASLEEGVDGGDTIRFPV